jgi:hypothetical protein
MRTGEGVLNQPLSALRLNNSNRAQSRPLEKLRSNLNRRYPLSIYVKLRVFAPQCSKLAMPRLAAGRMFVNVMGQGLHVNYGRRSNRAFISSLSCRRISVALLISGSPSPTQTLEAMTRSLAFRAR